MAGERASRGDDPARDARLEAVKRADKKGPAPSGGVSARAAEEAAAERMRALLAEARRLLAERIHPER